MKIVRHVPEGLEDHHIFELAEIGTPLPRERYRTGDRRIAAAS
jgi:hypothetical protein